MDLLFKRYASPFPLLTGYIQTERFCEFIQAFHDQKMEDDRWEFYLHRVWDKSYTEFCDSMQMSQALQSMSDIDMETTVKKSMDILGNFNPNQEEGGL
jgi:3-methyladenine DNA glycosylase Tag